MAKFEPLDLSKLPNIKYADLPPPPPLCGPFDSSNNNPEKKDGRPDHYLRNGIDVIDFAKMQFDAEELKGFYRINILKYVTRFDRKGGLEDLKKAEDYLHRLMELEAK